MSDTAFADALAREAARLPLLRACIPEETLATITPALPACGITRSASVTHLDVFGVPVWVSVRPGGKILQVSNGKGVTDAAAQVSALMEACELHLAENPDPARLRRTSMAQLEKAEPNARVVPPAELPGDLGGYFSPDFTAEWTSGTDLGTGARVWVPSSAVYFCRRSMLFETTTNGVASGNTRAEARLHAVYELIERDAMCALGEGGRLKLRERAQVIDPDSVTFPLARLILDRCAAQDTRVVLVALPAAVAVPAMWAIFLSTRALSTRTMVNTGWGAHARPEVALVRALTEAAQSRPRFTARVTTFGSCWGAPGTSEPIACWGASPPIRAGGRSRRCRVSTCPIRRRSRYRGWWRSCSAGAGARCTTSIWATPRCTCMPRGSSRRAWRSGKRCSDP